MGGIGFFDTAVFAPQKTAVYGITVLLILTCFTCSDDGCYTMQEQTAITAFHHKVTPLFTNLTHCKLAQMIIITNYIVPTLLARNVTESVILSQIDSAALVITSRHQALLLS